MASRTRPRGGKGHRLAVMGAINWDTTLFEKAFPMPGEEAPVVEVEEFPGGKGANAAVAAARILGRGRAYFVGAVGADAAGARLKESLAAEGVDTLGLVTVKDGHSGHAYVVVDATGAKTIHTHFGANGSMGSKHLSLPGPRSAIASADGVAIMDVPSLVALLVAKKARAAGARVFYSPGVRIMEGGTAVEEVIAMADDLVVDRAEVLKLCPKLEPDEACLELLRAHRGLVVVVTLGVNGCLVGRRGRVRWIRPFDLLAFGMTAVNSTGSGDAFLAAYAAYSLSGSTPEEAARWGNLAGALKAADIRTRGSPSKGQLEARMAQITRLRPGSPSKRAA